MSAQLQEWLRDLKLGEPIICQRVEILPFELPKLSRIDYRVLDETLSGKEVTIEEVSSAGSVPRVRVVNHCDHYVFVPDGVTLVGCKQNRVLNMSIMLAPQSKTELPVSCVEQGRWSTTSAGFSPAQHGDKSLREIMCAGTTQSLKSARTVRVDQAAVWGHVGSVLNGTRSHSPTGAYQEAYKASEQQLAAYEAGLRYPNRAQGVAVMVDGAIEVIELFDKPATLEKLWPRLMRSYAMEAVWREPRRGGSRDAREFLARAISAEWENFPSIGVGNTLRLTSKETQGAALVCGDQFVHVALFAVN